MSDPPPPDDGPRVPPPRPALDLSLPTAVLFAQIPFDALPAPAEPNPDVDAAAAFFENF